MFCLAECWAFFIISYANFLTLWAIHILNKRTQEMVLLKDNNQPLEVFCKKSVFKNCSNFTGKHLCARVFFFSLFTNFEEYLLTAASERFKGTL